VLRPELGERLAGVEGEIRQCRPKLWERLVWRRSAVVAERCRWPVWKRLARTTDVEEVGGGGRAASVAGV
jgi:hypothetical protein